MYINLFILSILMSKIILAVVLAGVVAQLLKIMFYVFKQQSFNWHDLIVTGGMPSSHSAFVTALTTVVYLEEGASTSFAVSVVLALIVLRDAFGVRRSVGEEGMMINQILRKLKIKTETHFSLGHTPAQVAVGILIGLLVALAVSYF